MHRLPDFVVIADTYVGLDESSTQIFPNRERAIEYADAENQSAESAGVPIHHRVFVLRELEESQMWDWGLRSPNGYVAEYVNERAARASVFGGVILVRRRAGTDEWHEVELAGDRRA